MVAIFSNVLARNVQTLQRTSRPSFHRCFLPSVGSFGQGFSEKIFFNRLIRNKKCGGHICQQIGTKCALLIKGHPQLLPTKCPFIWPSSFRGNSFSEESFLEIEQSETRIACDGQVQVHLAKRFQRTRFFRNRPMRNKNCLWRPCLLMDLNKFCNLYRAPSIDASYQVSVHLAKWFQRRRLKCEKQRQGSGWLNAFLGSWIT